ncbi:MAG: DUF2752 domain-containing protein [Acidimicrobiia bacterium]|nr:DUF2752 domain-containing protein [Acidimicrobiia bacterium]
MSEPVGVGVLGLAALVLVDPPDLGAPWCPSALIFATPCPLCGLTRGVSRLVRGDVGASLAFHPLAWLVLLAVTGTWVAWLGRRAGWWTGRAPRLERVGVVVLVAALVVTWVVRGATGTLPPISG